MSCPSTSRLKLPPGLRIVRPNQPKNGKDGIPGKNGFSPEIELDGTRIRVRTQSGYSDWIETKGENGSDGVAGKDGGPGTPGPMGKRGPQGLRGPQGERGKDGSRGPRGYQGDSGKDGTTGEIGPRGAQGRDGLTGQKGDTGDAPAHRWTGTKLQFQNSDGTWGKLVDLKGSKGDPGGGSGWLAILAAAETESADGVKYARRIDVVSDTVMYKGEAVPGSSDSSAVWRISRITTNAEGDVSEEWAGGVATFTQVWADRISLSYS